MSGKLGDAKKMPEEFDDLDDDEGDFDDVGDDAVDNQRVQNNYNNFSGAGPQNAGHL